jgi:hypothetical protein
MTVATPAPAREASKAYRTELSPVSFRTRCRCVAQSGSQAHLPPFRCAAAERAGSRRTRG